MRSLLFVLLFLFVCGSALAQSQTNVATLPVNYGGTSSYRNININATSSQISATAGNIYGWHLFNASNAVRFFKFYNTGSATVGTTTPLLTVAVGAGGVSNMFLPQGIAFSTGVSIGCVTAVADNSTSAPAANDCVGNIYYKNN